MHIRNHKLWGYWHKLSPNHSSDRTIVPRFIVMHYTAGWSGKASRDFLMSKDAQASAHLVLDRSGELWQIVPFDKRAWHAGPSRSGGYTDLNSHSIGVEIDNPGYLIPTGDGYVDWRRDPVSADRLEGYRLQTAPHPRLGSGVYAWAEYTDAQLNVLDETVKTLLEAYPTIHDIVSHEEIDTRRWKTDPGPIFPMRRYESLLQERRGSDLRTLVVTATRLNVRGGPGVEFETLESWGPLSRGATVTGLERHGLWWRIRGDAVGQEGWAHGHWLQDE